MTTVQAREKRGRRSSAPRAALERAGDMLCAGPEYAGLWQLRHAPQERERVHRRGCVGIILPRLLLSEGDLDVLQRVVQPASHG